MAIEITISSIPIPNINPRLLLSGIDSLYVGYFVNFGDRLDFAELMAQKELLRADREDLQEIKIGSETFALMPYGRHPYALTLRNKEMQVNLGRRIQPNCYVQFTSEGLWTQGACTTTQRFETWLNSLNADRLRRERVSRVDWAFDFDLPAVDFSDDHFVTRADKSATWKEDRHLQTVQLGTGATVVRVYDKVAEIHQQSDKAVFFDLWGQRENVWRTEFQVRVARLTQAGIHHLDQLPDLQADLLRELAQHHTRLCLPASDINRARWHLHPLWRQLIAAIAAMPQTGMVEEIAPAAMMNHRLYHQGRSLYGHLKGMATLLTAINRMPEPMSMEDTLKALFDLMEAHHHPPIWKEDVIGRLIKLRLGQW